MLLIAAAALVALIFDGLFLVAAMRAADRDIEHQRREGDPGP